MSAQQHGLVPLDAAGDTVRPALLGNDKRAQAAAADLVDALGGREAWAQAVGARAAGRPAVTEAALAGAERAGQRAPARRRGAAAARLAGVAVARRAPSAGPPTAAAPPGTGYWSAATGAYRPDLVELALGHQVELPEVIGPAEPAGRRRRGC